MESPFTERSFLLTEEACRERVLKALGRSWTPFVNKAVIGFSIGMPVIVMLLAMNDNKISFIAAIFITALFTFAMLICLSVLLLLLPDRADLIKKIRNGKGIVAILPCEPQFLSKWISQRIESKKDSLLTAENGEQMTGLHDSRTRQLDTASNWFRDAFEQLTGDSPHGLSWKGLILIVLMAVFPVPPVILLVGGVAVASRLSNFFLGNKNRPRIVQETTNYIVIHEEGVYFGGTMYSLRKPAVIRYFFPETPASSSIYCKLLTSREPWIMNFHGWGGFELSVPVPDDFRQRSLEIEAFFKQKQVDYSPAELHKEM